MDKFRCSAYVHMGLGIASALLSGLFNPMLSVMMSLVQWVLATGKYLWSTDVCMAKNWPLLLYAITPGSEVLKLRNYYSLSSSRQSFIFHRSRRLWNSRRLKWEKSDRERQRLCIRNVSSALERFNCTFERAPGENSRWNPHSWFARMRNATEFLQTEWLGQLPFV